LVTSLWRWARLWLVTSLWRWARLWLVTSLWRWVRLWLVTRSQLLKLIKSIPRSKRELIYCP